MPSDQPYQGTVGRTFEESTPWWPELEQGPAGAPNIVVVLLDDVGYAQYGCYGSDIATPTFDQLAAGGLRYSNFHTTSLCSPTRAALLTGRNHHTNGMGRIVEFASGFPGYDARIPKTNGFISAMLRAEGYATFALGKWHIAPAERDDARRPPRPLAARSGLRPLLRVPVGRDRPVPPRPGARQPSDRPSPHPRGGLPPDRGPGRSRHRVPQGPAGRLGPALLHLLRPRRVPLAPPGPAGLHRPLPGPVRPRVGRLARRGVRPPGGVGPRCPRAPRSASARRGCRRGTPCRTRSTGSTPG